MQDIPVQQIIPNPLQPRKDFDQSALDELANSIAIHGLITPITVEQLAPDRYQLIAGERRLRAVKQLGWLAIPAYIRNINGAGDQERSVLAITENIQRTDLNPLEKAAAFGELRDRFGLTFDQIGRACSTSTSAVPVYLQLLKLPVPVQEHYAARRLPIDNQVIRLLVELNPDTAVRMCEQWAKYATPANRILVTLRRLVKDGSEQPYQSQPAHKRKSNAPRSNVITEIRNSAGGHWNAIAQLKYHGSPVNPVYIPAAEDACRNCVLYEDASTVICSECPAVDLLKRLP